MSGCRHDDSSIPDTGFFSHQLLLPLPPPLGRSEGLPNLCNPRTHVCCDGHVPKRRPGKKAVINFCHFLLLSF